MKFFQYKFMLIVLNYIFLQTLSKDQKLGDEALELIKAMEAQFKAGTLL